MLAEWQDQYNPFNPMKIMAHADRLEKIADGEFPPPVVINWDLWDRVCNYDCQFCIWKKRKGIKPDIVPIDIALKIPKFLHNWGVKSVCLPGGHGDPTLYPNLHKVLKELHYWNLDIGLVSNGHLLTGKLMRAAAHYCKFMGFSVDFGDAKEYAKYKGVSELHFHEVMANIKQMAKYKQENNLDVEIGFKYLIFPTSYKSLYEGAKIARDCGANHFQIRPAHLPVEEIKKIDVEETNRQIEKAMELETNTFKVIAMRHKFEPDFKKKQPNHCYATPLTSTWLADGSIILCTDLRDENYNTLCNYIKDGLYKVKELWGSEKHRKLIEGINKRLDNCKRCTNFPHQEIIEKAFVKDNMDIRLI